jgi:hypothetical protein
MGLTMNNAAVALAPAGLLEEVSHKGKTSPYGSEPPNDSQPRSRLSLGLGFVPSLFVITFISLLLCLTTLFFSFARWHGLQTRSVDLTPSFHARMAELALDTFHDRARRHGSSARFRTGLYREVSGVLSKSRTLRGSSLQGLSNSIVTESLHASLDPLFVAAIVKHESTYNEKAVSPKGALGLMQVLPGTGRYVSEMRKFPWSGSEKLLERDYNLRIGIAYLRYLERFFEGNWEHILIAYNWGPHNLLRALEEGRKVPGSPLRYARSIISTHLQWRDEFPLGDTKLVVG